MIRLHDAVGVPLFLVLFWASLLRSSGSQRGALPFIRLPALPEETHAAAVEQPSRVVPQAMARVERPRPAPFAPGPPPWRVVAALVSSDQRASSALLIHERTGQSLIARVGRRIDEGEVLRISRLPLRVVVLLDDGTEAEIGDRSGSGPAPRLTTSPESLGLRTIGERTMEVPMALLQMHLQNLPVLAGQVHISPMFRDGAGVGFRLNTLSENSVVRQLGLLPGDILTRVNGRPLQSMSDVMQLWSGLQFAREFDIQVERNGRLQAHHFLIR